MGYDSLYTKYRDRDKAIEKLKKTDLIKTILFIIVAPAVVTLAAFLITKKFNLFICILSFAAAAAFSVTDLVRRHKNGYRYVHCTHDVKGILKPFEAEHGKGVYAYGEIASGACVFKYTLSNEARINCDTDFGTYTFTVYNDEWDEVEKFKAESEEAFKKTMIKALEFAISLEKKPDGEYDETLMPDEDVSGEEYEDENGEEFDDDEDEEKG